MPLGLGRRAEPEPGLDVDPAVLLLGAAALVSVVLAAGGAIVWRGTARSTTLRTPRRSRLERWTDRLPWPTTATGIRLALPGGSGVASSRVGLAGGAAGLAGVVAALVFGASLTHLLDTARLYGATWSVAAMLPEDADLDTVVADPAVEAAATGAFYLDVVVEGLTVKGVAFDAPLKGDIGPAIVDGRAPQSADEVALGSATLERLDRSIGDTVEISGPGGARQARIVGRAVFGSTGDPVPVAEGVALTPELLEAVPVVMLLMAAGVALVPARTAARARLEVALRASS